MNDQYENADNQISASFDKNLYMQPEGLGFYPSFHALWHLKSLGVVNDPSTFTSTHWKNAQDNTPVRVAVIDTPVAWNHPNLQGAVNLALMRDFSAYDDGAFVFDARPRDGDSDDMKNLRIAVLQERKESLKWLGSDKAGIANRIRDEVSEAEDPKLELSRPPCSPMIYGAHGTAVAGLIAGRPIITLVRKPAYLGVVSDVSVDSGSNGITLPYCGINPFCEIVPISTSASPDPTMVFAALTYARMIKAAVVVIAAAWEDAGKLTKEPAKAGEGNEGNKACDPDTASSENVEGKVCERARDNKGHPFDPEGEDWAAVEKELYDLAKGSFVLCAAGNSGDAGLAYPACLANHNNRLIAVTACREDGQVLSYSPAPGNSGQIIKTLSSEAPRYDRNDTSLDPWAYADPELGIPAGDPKYPPRRIISLDPPGPFGYNPSPYHYTPPPEGPHLEVGSLFAEFSGTSAATAIAAGLISLAIQANIAPVEKKEGDSASNLFDLNAAAAARIDRGTT